MSDIGPAVAELVERLGLEPHPEGGWYRRTWVHPDPAGSHHAGPADRAAGSAILYLQAAGSASRWHRVDAAEVWIHGGGGPLVLETWVEGEPQVTRHLLGGPTDADSVPQHVVPAGVWQRSVGGSGWTLVTCVVVPEFRPEGFEMAEDDWSPPVD